MIAKNWVYDRHGYILGTFDLEFDGWIFRRLTLHEQGTTRWVTLPSIECTIDGKTVRYPVIEFQTKAQRQAFCNDALAVIDTHLAELERVA
jgi:hypothetical protein